jgi:hypothetical protein
VFAKTGISFACEKTQASQYQAKLKATEYLGNRNFLLSGELEWECVNFA